jgi:hypothetical protein
VASSSSSRWRPDITTGGKILPWSAQFKYLGAQITDSGGVDAEIRQRVGLAVGVFRRLQRPFFAQRCIALQTRLTVLRQLVLSVLLYGCESWALSQLQLQWLERCLRGFLRQILGVRRSDRISNETLYLRCGRPDPKRPGTIVPFESLEIMWRRRVLRWLGHIGRMEDTRLAKQLLWAVLSGGAGRRGRPPPSLPEVYRQQLSFLRGSEDFKKARKKWQAQQERAGAELFGFSWLEACQDRDAWRTLVDNAVAPTPQLV